VPKTVGPISHFNGQNSRSMLNILLLSNFRCFFDNENCAAAYVDLLTGLVCFIANFLDV